jgi:hypothetical protein
MGKRCCPCDDVKQGQSQILELEQGRTASPNTDKSDKFAFN